MGVRLQFRSTADLPDLAGFAYRKLFRRLADLDMHVQLHDEGARLPQSIGLIEPSSVKLVVDHFGRPDLSRGADAEAFVDLLRAVERGRTWVKLSAAFRLRPLAALRPFAGESDRDIFAARTADVQEAGDGSRGPAGDLEDELSFIDKVMRGNASWVDVKYSQVQPMIQASQAASRKKITGARWKKIFIDICDDDTIATAVTDLGLSGDERDAWVKEEKSIF